MPSFWRLTAWTLLFAIFAPGDASQAGWPFSWRRGTDENGAIPASPQCAHPSTCYQPQPNCQPCESKHRFCECLAPKTPPRGDLVFSIPARIDRESFDRLAEESGDREKMDDRVNKVEQDLTRLTLIVEEMAKSQQRIQEDSTRNTLLLEELAKELKN